MRLSGFNLPWSTIWMLILKFLFRLTLAQSFHMLFEVVGDIPIPSTAFTDNRTMYFMHGPKLTYLNIVLVGLNKKTLSTRECEIINTENTTTNTHFITHERTNPHKCIFGLSQLQLQLGQLASFINFLCWWVISQNSLQIFHCLTI